MNFVLWLRNVQITAVPSCKRVDLLMLRNRVFRVRNVKYGQYCEVRKLIYDAQESLIQFAKRSNVVSAALKDFDFLILRNRVFRL